jgi:D-alanine-D-alanine ligase
VRERIAIVYNQPARSRYNNTGEEKAVLGVLGAVNRVHQVLVESRHSATIVPLSPPYEEVRNTLYSIDTDLVFNLFEGFPGEPQSEAIVPEILSEIGIPYTGSPASVLKNALDKAEVKKILLTAGIPTPDFQLLSPQKLNVFRLNYPCIVKPANEDASHGISAESVVNDFSSLANRIKVISDLYGKQALVENYIKGREFNVTVLGNSRCSVLPVSEIVYSLPPEMPAILTFDAKWEQDSVYYKGTEVMCPAEITRRERESINQIALAAFHLLKCTGYARIDLRMDERGKIYVLEVNPNPDISPEAGVARQATASGMKYNQLIDRIIKLAWEKKKNDDKNKSRGTKRQVGIN